MNNCLGKVLEQRVEDVPRMRVFFLQIATARNHMGNHMPFKQWDVALEVKDQIWPRIGEGKVGEGEKVLRVETRQLRRSGVHLVNSLEEVGEGFVDISREGFIVVWQGFMHVVVLFWNWGRIKRGRNLPSDVCSGVLEVSGERGSREGVIGGSRVKRGGSRSRGMGSGPDADGAKGSKLESGHKKLGGEWDLVGTITAVRAMHNP